MIFTLSSAVHYNQLLHARERPCPNTLLLHFCFSSIDTAVDFFQFSSLYEYINYAFASTSKPSPSFCMKINITLLALQGCFFEINLIEIVKRVFLDILLNSKNKTRFSSRKFFPNLPFTNLCSSEEEKIAFEENFILLKQSFSVTIFLNVVIP